MAFGFPLGFPSTQQGQSGRQAVVVLSYHPGSTLDVAAKEAGPLKGEPKEITKLVCLFKGPFKPLVFVSGFAFEPQNEGALKNRQSPLCRPEKRGNQQEVVSAR